MTTEGSKSSISILEIILILVIISLVCLVVLLIFSNPSSRQNTQSSGPTPTNNPPEATKSQVYNTCKQLLTAILLSPSTAKFASVSEAKWWRIEGYESAYRISGYVDAQNAYGGMIRNNFHCDLRYKGGEWTDIRNWEALALDVSP